MKVTTGFPHGDDYQIVRILRKLRCQLIRKSETEKICYDLLMIKSVNDLEVYIYSLELLKDLYEFLNKVPASEYDSVKNVKRASKSIPTNLSEGFAKRSSQATFKNHLKICIGSSDEVITHIVTLTIVVPRLKLAGDILIEKYTVLSKRLNKLHSVWKSDKF